MKVIIKRMEKMEVEVVYTIEAQSEFEAVKRLHHHDIAERDDKIAANRIVLNADATTQEEPDVIERWTVASGSTRPYRVNAFFKCSNCGGTWGSAPMSLFDGCPLCGEVAHAYRWKPLALPPEIGAIVESVIFSAGSVAEAVAKLKGNAFAPIAELLCEKEIGQKGMGEEVIVPLNQAAFDIEDGKLADEPTLAALIEFCGKEAEILRLS